MAKIKNANPIASIHGKLAKADKVIYRVKDGVQQAYVVKNPYMGPPSEAQSKNRNAFRERTQQIKAIYSNPTLLDAWKKRFKEYRASDDYAQKEKKNTTLYGFIMSSLAKQ